MDKETVVRTSQIRVNIGLNGDNVPVDMTWEADDHAGAGPEPCKAMLLSLFERKAKETLRIDLWTKDLQVAEMDRLVFHTLRGLADSYLRASQNQAMDGPFRQFIQFFGEETGILGSQGGPLDSGQS